MSHPDEPDPPYYGARTAELLQQMQGKLLAVESLCRRYAHAGCEPGKHAVCSEILRILEGK